MFRTLAQFAALSDGGRWKVSLIHIAWVCVLAGAGLSLLGVYAIDLGVIEGARRQADPDKQLVFLAVGVFAAAVVALPHYRLIGYLAWPAMLVTIALLVFLRLPGVPEWLVRPVNGARSWIKLGVVDFQPSELAKVSYVLVTARYLRFRRSHRRFIGLVPLALLTGVPVGLIMLQPDLGTAMLFAPALFAMLVAAGARIKHLVLIVAIAALAAPAAYPLLLPHQKARIGALISQVQGANEGAEDINYQSLTAQRLAGAGGIAGAGEEHSKALIRFNVLPERHNDMIFSIIIARFGLLGALGVLALYLLWIAGALAAAAVCKDPFGRLVIVGLAAFIAAQMVVNIGMNIGLLPIIGITLPFVSYGGSSLVTVWLMTGLIVNIAMRRPLPPYRQSFEYASGDE